MMCIGGLHKVCRSPDKQTKDDIQPVLFQRTWPGLASQTPASPNDVDWQGSGSSRPQRRQGGVLQQLQPQRVPDDPRGVRGSAQQERQALQNGQQLQSAAWEGAGSQ